MWFAVRFSEDELSVEKYVLKPSALFDNRKLTLHVYW